MIAVETIGRPSWPKRVRAWLSDLFGSAYIAHLERELLQAKVERDKVIAELRAENRELLNRLLAAKQIVPVLTQGADAKGSRTALPKSRWEQQVAQAIADNAKAEAEEAQNPKSQEN